MYLNDCHGWVPCSPSKSKPIRLIHKIYKAGRYHHRINELRAMAEIRVYWKPFHFGQPEARA
jgi:hypothetical protein